MTAGQALNVATEAPRSHEKVCGHTAVGAAILDEQGIPLGTTTVSRSHRPRFSRGASGSKSAGRPPYLPSQPPSLASLPPLFCSNHIARSLAGTGKSTLSIQRDSLSLASVSLRRRPSPRGGKRRRRQPREFRCTAVVYVYFSVILPLYYSNAHAPCSGLLTHHASNRTCVGSLSVITDRIT